MKCLKKFPPSQKKSRLIIIYVELKRFTPQKYAIYHILLLLFTTPNLHIILLFRFFLLFLNNERSTKTFTTRNYISMVEKKWYRIPVIRCFILSCYIKEALFGIITIRLDNIFSECVAFIEQLELVSSRLTWEKIV